MASDTTVQATRSDAIPGERSVLVVEDDRSFLQRLGKALEQRGFDVTTAETVADGLSQVEQAAPAFAVVDMRLGDGTGLDVISALKRRRPEARGIILTGYGNIATAVTAVKLGAVDYLAKPCDADDVVAALLAQDNSRRSSRRKIRCRPTACAGSISSASTNCAAATSRRRRAGSTCIAAPCSGFWRSARRSNCHSGARLRRELGIKQSIRCNRVGSGFRARR